MLKEFVQEKHVLHSSGVLVHPLAVRRSPTDEP